MSAGKLRVSVREIKGRFEITLAGNLSDQTALCAELVEPGRSVVVDTGGVLDINSAGVRAWVRFLDSLCQRSANVVIRRPPPVLVRQASTVPNFLGRARVESFSSFWTCVQCGGKTELLHHLRDAVPELGQCPGCGGPTELDDNRQRYLAFRELAGAAALTSPR